MLQPCTIVLNYFTLIICLRVSDFLSIAMMYVFEDNEAVIKMTIKGRSPTMRHVPRTHRVSLDWLFDRNNLDPKILIRYIDTKHQIADILTKRNFTRDEWNDLPCLFNLIRFNLISCTERMAKRMQEQSEENRIVAKSRPTAMNLTSSVATISSPVNSPIASRSPGILKASSRQVGLSGRPDGTNQKSNPDAASRSQGWHRDAQLFISLGRPVATDKDQKSLNRQEKSVMSTGELAAAGYQRCSENPEIPEDSEPKSRIWPHHFRTSPDCVPHMEKVFSIVRKIYDRKPTDDLKDLDVNTAICGIFMSVTLQAAVHLGRDYSLNLRSVKNQSSKSMEQLIISDNREVDQRSDGDRRIVHD